MLLSNRNLVEPSGWPSAVVNFNLRSKAGFDERIKFISTAIESHAKKIASVIFDLNIFLN